MNCAQDEVQPINWACLWGHTAAARAILRDPSVVQHVAARKSDALSWCCHKGHAETLKVLLESVHISHTHSNSPTPLFRTLTPLQLAVCEKDLKTVELVLEQGVDVNECHAGKRSALGIAASNHSYEMCSALLARGASVRASNADGLTAMHYLLRASKDHAAHDTAALVHLFLTERPNDNLQNDILYYLKVYRLYSAVIQKLLSAGAPLNDRTENGLTALHITVYDALTVKDNWDAEILRYNVRTLVLGGADLLAKTTAPATNEDVVLANGAPIPAGLTPMDVARTCGLQRRRDAVVAELTAAIAQRAL